MAAVLEALAADGLAAWLDGGWGIDALLGRQTREHADLDLVLARGALPRAEALLARLGYRPDPEAAPGPPARFVLRAGVGRQVDVHPVVFDDRGGGWQDLGGGAWGRYPADGLTGVGVVGGRYVRCLTPRLQLRHHLGYPWTDLDRHDMGLLAARFDLALPPGA